ncbi:tumor necrosis factor receptor superfamily member 13B [Anguilla rostrata]|uniref:tumor necrosis factor receptor superfamily member 13B n=1 Tax=Anguilla rostrata TaxID=7938 RepID=UPI0030D324F1
MDGSCSDSEYWDQLVRMCLSCERRCEHSQGRCVEFCASLHCRASPGNFYDPLLKQCMQCAELCGSHPVECAQACKAQPTARSLTRLPEDGAALTPPTTRGSSFPRGEHHTVIIYSLLGLCLAALFCTLSVALVALLCRSRGRGARGARRAGPQEEQETSDDALHPSSKDRLMDAVVGGRGHEEKKAWPTVVGGRGHEEKKAWPTVVGGRGHEEKKAWPTVVGGRGHEEKKAWPTETCVHCFPELRVQQRVEDKLPPPNVYQQATGMAPPSEASTLLYQDGVAVATNRHASLHGPGGKDGALRIICSPTQSG